MTSLFIFRGTLNILYLDIQVRMYLALVKPTNNLQKMYKTNLNKCYINPAFFLLIFLYRPLLRPQDFLFPGASHTSSYVFSSSKV